MNHRRRGFTLIEVMIALTLTGLVAMMARALVQVTIDAVKALETARGSTDQEFNGRGWLRSTLLSLEAGDSNGSFAGNPQRLEFGSWQQQPGGWLVRKRIVIEVRHGSLIAAVARNEPIPLSDSVSAVEFDYLLEPGANTRWVQRWLSPVSAPLAVRIRITHRARSDTMLYLIRERG